MKNKLRVFSIEEFSVYDGPGIRTTIFFKGCPLRCSWCHSPEGQSYQNIALKSPNGCLHCNRCVGICPYKQKKCIGCLKCVSVCPRNLIRSASEDYTINQLYKIVEKNFKILNINNGGITLSGGEPLMQGSLLIKFIDKIDKKTHIALQTSGYGDSELFKKIISKIDLVLFDMKIMDKEKALIYEKIDNTLIFENLEILKKSTIPFIVRVPLIPQIVDTEDNLKKIISYVKGCKNFLRVELLPYNKFAGSKYKMANMVYEPMFDESIPSNPHLELFEKENIEVRVL